MTRSTSIGAVAVLGAMSLAGCAAPEPSAQPGAPSAAVKPAILTPAQESALRGELHAIDPALDTPRLVPNAMMVCKAMGRGLPEQAQREQVGRIFFQSADTAVAPEGAADRIIEVIKANGLCQA